MKLYNLDHSPYATRVRMQIYKKGLDIAIEPPPEALGSDAFLSRFPMGKIPVLELDDGSQLPDSWAIMRYLDEVLCAGTCSPDDALGRAHMEVLLRYADTYLAPGGLFPLFKRIGQPDAGDPGDDLVALDAELARLERVLAMQPPFTDRALHMGDMALVPHLDFVLMLAPMFGVAEPLANYPGVQAWFD